MPPRPGPERPHAARASSPMSQRAREAANIARFVTDAGADQVGSRQTRETSGRARSKICKLPHVWRRYGETRPACCTIRDADLRVETLEDDHLRALRVYSLTDWIAAEDAAGAKLIARHGIRAHVVSSS